jgi:putative ABC transport system permease protein
VRVDGEHNYTVTGVVQDCPANSHLRFDGLLSMQTRYVEDPQGMARWGRGGFYTYAVLRDHTDPRVVEAKLAGLVEENLGETLRNVGAEVELLLQPLNRTHLYSDFQADIAEGGNIHTVWLFSGIATLVLLIACFNFINLSTARSMRRAREVGMRKTLGATRKRLIGQFLGESVWYSLMAMALACMLVEIVLPTFNDLSLRPLSISYFSDPLVIPGLILFAVLVGILAGIYPAVYLSSSNPARSLKTGFQSAKSRSRFRAALVVIQFSISTILIFGTLAVYQQIEYMKNKRLGFDKERVLVISNIDNLSDQTRETLKNELSELAGVVSAGVSSSVPIAGPFPRMNFLPEGFADDENELMITVAADAEMLNTLGVEIVAGRNFSPDFGSDSLSAVLINETAARRFRWDDPIGKTIQRRAFTPEGPVWQTTRVIGVVADFHLQSLHQEIEPLIIRSDFAPPFNLASTIGVRLAPGSISDMVELVRQTWGQIIPDQGIDYLFIDDSFNAQYRAEERLGRIAVCFSILAVFVGCLGLFGMISHAIEQRTKEIGIRKVLGASVGGVVSLLSRDYVIIVLVAAVIAWPVGYFGMNSWLENFAYRTSIGLDIFAVSMVLALLIAVSTIGYQAVKASRSNPVKALRYE